ncbi:helix-turn-helix domain-containing protein [Klebsiella pneumoniae]|uniref:helix-turn-helix domain-containing protein n=1 Tax=Burkholderia anthina TaxID=179879 RepID=UPI00158C994F|nr:transcriptional regulator [Klebsiella oxytoca]
MDNPIIESLRDDLVALREFDVICPPPMQEFSAYNIKRLRERLKFSRPVFVHRLYAMASTVLKWEQGKTRFMLLNVIADKGW